MGLHSYNHGLVTSSKGKAIEFVKVTDLDETPGAAVLCTVDDGDSNLILQVIHSATGTFDVYLNKPYPPKLLVCLPDMSSAAGITDLDAAYKSGSYDATTGVFTVFVSNDDGDGTPALADGAATDELHMMLVFSRYTTL